MQDSYSVLYAEDDNVVRKNYILFLENYFDNIYEAENGKKALEIYTHIRPDVLLIDITMPELNGLDLVKIVREKDQETPIIILSAHSDKEYLFEAVKLNLVDYLIKPVNRNEFKNVIQGAISKLKENVIIRENYKIIITKDCYWNKETQIFFYKDKILDLTKNERMLFELLLNKKNSIVTQSDISSYIWENQNDNINDASIRNLVKRLRKKLPVDIVQSIYGSGYILSF
jgi:DNA-binding response OmpR family regulator